MSKTTAFVLPRIGMDNLTSESALRKGAVREAVNVDIDRSGSFSRRRGSILRSPSGRLHSLFYAAQKDWTLIADGSMLNRLDTRTYALTPLYELGSDTPVSYAQYNGNIYFTNTKVFGWIPSDTTSARAVGVPTPDAPSLTAAPGNMLPGHYTVCLTTVNDRGEESGASETCAIHLPHGGGIHLSGLVTAAGTSTRAFITSSDGDVLHDTATWPSVFPTYTLGATSAEGKVLETQFLQPLPPGEHLCWHNGRLITAHQGVVRFSEPLRPHLHNPKHGVIPFSGHVAFLLSVGEGVFVGDSRGIWFLAGTDPSKFEQRFVTTTRAYARSALNVPSEVLAREDIPPAIPIALWLGPTGYVAGLPNGAITPLQDKRLRLPERASGASALLTHDGRTQLLTLADSRGTVVGAALPLPRSVYIPPPPPPPPPNVTDWIAGAGMFQDLDGLIPVTMAGQRLRCWQNLAGARLLADTANGWSVRSLGGVLTPYLTLTEGGGLVAAGTYGAGVTVHQIATLGAAAAANCFGALTPAGGRSNECWTYGSLAGGIYNGADVTNGTGVLTAANKTLYTAVFGTDITMRVNGVLKIAGGALSAGDILTVVGRIPTVTATNAATALHRVRVSTVAQLAADEAELITLLPPRPLLKIATLTDSNFCDVIGSTTALGVNGRLAETYTVIAHSVPGAGILTDDFSRIALAGPYEAAISCYTNDLNGIDAAAYWTRLKAAFDLIGCDKRVVVSPWDRTNNFVPEYAARCADLRALIAADTAYVHINGSVVVGLAGLGDGIHPNELGVAGLTAALQTAI